MAAFTGEKKEADRYSVKLIKAQSVGVKSGRAIAQGLATVLFIIFASYGLGMWFGAKEIVEDHEANPGCVETGTCKVNGGDVLVVFWSILFASMSIGKSCFTYIHTYIASSITLLLAHVNNASSRHLPTQVNVVQIFQPSLKPRVLQLN